MSQSEKNMVETILESTNTSKLLSVEDHPFVVVPDDHHVHDMEGYLSGPIRIRAKQYLHDMKSFAEYVNKFKNDSSIIFADQDKSEIKAMLDYHAPDGPSWCGHSASYRLVHSDEWKAWLSGNDKYMTQKDFAEFIEDHIADITEPSGADMLEIALKIQAQKNVNYRSSIVLENGSVDFSYTEEVQGSSRDGHLEIPKTLKIGIPVYKNGSRYEIDAKFRYSLRDGQLKLGYVLVKPDVVIEHVFNKLAEEAKSTTQLTVFIGEIK